MEKKWEEDSSGVGKLAARIAVRKLKIMLKVFQKEAKEKEQVSSAIGKHTNI